MKIDVKHIAKLANLPVSNDEEKKFEQQLADTLTYIEELNEVDTTGVEITPQVTGLENILEEDTVRPSLSQEEATSNAKNSHNGFFIVPAILEENS
jgi:aspartyl-tRNA(Asn)/glutamyl-tRNA(Gln) amidotransferase subunit C